MMLHMGFDFVEWGLIGRHWIRRGEFCMGVLKKRNFCEVIRFASFTRISRRFSISTFDPWISFEDENCFDIL